MSSDKPKYDPSLSAGPFAKRSGKDLKLAQEENRIRQDRYRVLIEDVADGFYEVDLSGNFRFFNKALCRIFGYSKNEIQDRNFT